LTFHLHFAYTILTKIIGSEKRQSLLFCCATKLKTSDTKTTKLRCAIIRRAASVLITATKVSWESML